MLTRTSKASLNNKNNGYKTYLGSEFDGTASSILIKHDDSIFVALVVKLDMFFLILKKLTAIILL